MHAQNKLNLKIQFEEGKTLSYHVVSTIVMKQRMDVWIPHIANDLDEDYRLEYDLYITPVEFLEDGCTMVLIETENITSRFNSWSEGNLYTETIIDSEVFSDVEGYVGIDTKNGIGEELAEEIINEIAGLYKSGLIKLDKNGKIIEIKGSDEFETYWKKHSMSTIGFLGIVFPQQSIEQYEFWETSLSLDTEYGIEIEKPLKLEVMFSWTDNKTVDNEVYMTINASSPFYLTGIKGVIPTYKQDVPMDIKQFKGTVSSEVLFANESGVVNNNLTVIEGEAIIKFNHEDSETTMEYSLKKTLNISLLE